MQRVVGAEDKTEVFGADQVFGDGVICEPEFLARIMDVSTQDADCMCQVGSGPDSEMDQFAMGSPYLGAQFNIDLGGAVF